MEKELKILIVEHEKADVELLNRELKKIGLKFQFKDVDTMDGFRREIQEHNPDLIFTDFKFSDFNAFDLLDIAKELSCHTPIIIYTGSIGEERSAECIKAGAADFILKDNLIRLPGVVAGAIKKKELEEEVRNKQKALIKSEFSYRELFEKSIAGIYKTTLDGRILEANQALANILGVESVEELKSMRTLDFYSNPSDRSSFLNDLKKDKQLTSYGEFLKKKDGTPVWVLENSSLVVEEGQAEPVIHGTMIDITELRQKELMLNNLYERLSSFIDNSPEAISLVDLEGNIFRINPAFTKIYGWTLEELAGAKFPMLPEDRLHEIDYIQEQIKEGRVVKEFETKRKKKDGTLFDVSLTVYPIRDIDGKIVGSARIAKDITEKKLMEEALRASEEKYRSMVEMLNDVVYTCDLEGTITYMSPAVERVTQYKREEIIGRKIFDFILPEDVPAVLEAIKDTLEGTGKHLIFRIKDKDGAIKYARGFSNTVIKDGKPVGLVGILTDVTEIVHKEEEVKLALERLQSFINNAPLSIIIRDLDGTVLSVNPSFERFTGWKAEEVIGKKLQSEELGIVPQHLRNEFYDLRDKVLRGERVSNYEQLRYRRDGSKYIVSVTYSPIKDKNGTIVGIVSMAQDVTEKKRAEEEAKAARERYEALFNYSADSIAIRDLEGNIVEVNESWVKEYGYSQEEVKEGEIELIPEDMKSEFSTLLNQVIQGKAISGLETKRLRKSGEVIDLSLTMSPLRDSEGKVVAISTIGRNITEKKRVEKELIDTKERLEALFNSSADAIAIFALTGEILMINPSYEKIYGWKKEEILGKSFMTVPNHLLEESKSILERVKQGETVYNYETIRKKKDGTLFDVSITISPLRDAEGRVWAASGISRDISEKKKAEELLRASELKYRSLFETIPIGVYQTTLEGKIVTVNQALADIFGYTMEEMLNIKTPDLYYYPEVREEIIKILKANLEVKNYELILKRKDGSKITALLNSKLIFNEAGEVAYLEGTLIDITEKKIAEEKLQESLLALKRTLEGAVNSLSIAVELRDPYTAGHEKRVTQLAMAIAKEMGFSEDSVEAIKFAGILHDIGKLNIPSEILSKPRKLNAVEYSIIKTHSQAGSDIVKNIEFPWPIHKMILQHHERLDGSGYPAGLKDGEIMKEALILAVADVVESMSSHRPYRPAFTIEEALEEITNNKGILYDPEVVEACITLFKEKGFQIMSLED